MQKLLMIALAAVASIIAVLEFREPFVGWYSKVTLRLTWSNYVIGGMQIVLCALVALLTVELAMEIEETFDISIPDDRASEMLTVGDAYESRRRSDIWNALQLIAAEQLSVDRSMVVPHA
ncbi:MAG: hypothetical protein LW850_34320 [Planctomycetaceae bacterium]|jgi:hypothetical protein|nr:hypothetical protein [Planctomycetaceae bacterium]